MGSGRWKRTRDFITTVDADSALLQLSRPCGGQGAAACRPLDDGQKFDTRNAAGYRTALDRLRQFTKDAPGVVAARFSKSLCPTAFPGCIKRSRATGLGHAPQVGL